MPDKMMDILDTAARRRSRSHPPRGTSRFRTQQETERLWVAFSQRHVLSIHPRISSAICR